MDRRRLCWASAAAALVISAVLGVGCAGGGPPGDPGPTDPQRVTVRFDMSMGSPTSGASMRGQLWDDANEVGLESDAGSMNWDVATRVLSGNVRVLNASPGILYGAQVRVDRLTPTGAWPNFDATVELSWYVTAPTGGSGARARSSRSGYQVNDDTWNYGNVPAVTGSTPGQSAYANWAFTAPVPNSLSTAPWPCFGADLRNTRSSNAAGPATSRPPITFDTGAAVWGGPAIGPNGIVYVGSTNGKVYSLTLAESAFTKNWEYVTGGPIYSTPAVARDGTIYVGSDDYRLHAITATGTGKWAFLTGGTVESPPAIGRDGTVYVGSSDGKLYAVNPDGTRRWEFHTGGVVLGSPAIGDDGTVYVGSRGSFVYALNGETGAEVWSYETTGVIDGSPAVGPDGAIYVGDAAGRVYGLKSDGTQKWAPFSVGGAIASSPALSADGSLLYVAVKGNSRLYALNTADGSSKWYRFFSGTLEASPAVGSGGDVYIGVFANNTSLARFHATNSAGTSKWQSGTMLGFHSSPAIGSDSTIYVGRDDGMLCAFPP